MKKKFFEIGQISLASQTDVDVEVSEEVEAAIKELMSRSIILYNDDHNTFDHVVECLVNYCDHQPLQAEQCALIVHHNGKCSIKNGTFEDLKPICEALLENGLSAKID
jgi:ATP-dependent Clp protease adaptor protein ClpS